MNPENGGQETNRRPKLPIRKNATMEEGFSRNVSPLPVAPAGPVYAPVPLRMAWPGALGNGLHGTVMSAVPAAPIPWMMNMRPQFAPAAAPPAAAPRAAAPPVAAPQAAAPQHEYEKDGLFLITMLHSCAAAVAEGETELLIFGLEWISRNAPDDGEEPMQRLASSFAEALALRMVQPWITAPAQEAVAARRHFPAMCPFLRISGVVANHAIVDAVAVQPGGIVHVVDLGGTDPNQWLHFLGLFATRTRNLILRLTIVNEHEEFLSETHHLLATEAYRLGRGFLFQSVRLNIDQLFSVDALDVRSAEALVIVSTLQLHRLLADEFAELPSSPHPHDRKGKKIMQANHGAQSQHMMTTRADALLRDLRQLSPNLIVVTEQEADHNDADFKKRFGNALEYYGALFDALEESVPAARGSAAERTCVEQHLLREEIKDIVGRDGALRRERHEKLEQWAARMEAARFAPAAAMTEDAMAEAAMLAQEQLPGGTYRVSGQVNEGRLFIYRNAIPMFSVSTWRPL